MLSYEIKSKLRSALNSKNVTSFLKNVLNDNGLGLSNSPSIVNRFLYELIENNDDIKIIDNGNRKKAINDIEIYNKKILVRTNSIRGVNKFSFKTFGYEKEDEIDCKKTLNEINEKLSCYDYIFLIRIAEEYEGKRIRACYHYYLFPSEIFRIKGIEEMNVEEYKKNHHFPLIIGLLMGIEIFILNIPKD